MSELSIGVVRWYSISYIYVYLIIHCRDCPSIHHSNAKQLDRSWWNLEKKNYINKLLASNLMTKVWYQESVSRHHFIWDFTRPKLLPFLSASEDHGFAVPEKSRKMEELERLSTTALMHRNFQSSRLFYENRVWKYDIIFWQFQMVMDIIHLMKFLISKLPISMQNKKRNTL